MADEGHIRKARTPAKSSRQWSGAKKDLRKEIVPSPHSSKNPRKSLLGSLKNPRVQETIRQKHQEMVDCRVADMRKK
jgi:hypothetical protein